MAEIKTCRECMFFNAINEDSGECHRQAPVPVIHLFDVNQIKALGCRVVWPLIPKKDFCGEFKERGTR